MPGADSRRLPESGRRSSGVKAALEPKADSPDGHGRDLDAFEFRHAKANLHVSIFNLKAGGARPSYPDMAGRMPRIEFRVRRCQDHNIDSGSTVRGRQGDP